MSAQIIHFAHYHRPRAAEPALDRDTMLLPAVIVGCLVFWFAVGVAVYWAQGGFD